MTQLLTYLPLDPAHPRPKHPPVARGLPNNGQPSTVTLISIEEERP